MRKIEIVRGIMKLVDKERRGEFSKAASTLATIRELIVEERPILVHYNKDQMNLEGIE